MSRLRVCSFIRYNFKNKNEKSSVDSLAFARVTAFPLPMGIWLRYYYVSLIDLDFTIFFFLKASKVILLLNVLVSSFWR